MTDQALAMARQLDLEDSEVSLAEARAGLRALAGLNREALAEADATLKMKGGDTPSSLAILADIYARAGEEAKAEQLIIRAKHDRPDDEFLANVWSSVIHAVIAMNHHKPDEAVEIMKAAVKYDRATFESRYTRGMAQLSGGHPAEAIEEFQGILKIRAWAITDPFLAYAQLGMARAYAQQGDAEKARTAYQDFLASWKQADPDLPVLKQVQAEYAKLK